MYRDRAPGGGEVVIIDDDEAARESVGQMLDLRGYKVKLFSSAEAALWTANSCSSKRNAAGSAHRS
jgi:FixJ family two-component response regulator